MPESKEPAELAFDEWRSHPVTRDFFRFIGDFREALKEEWAQGVFAGPDGEAKGFEALGQARMIERLQNLEVEDLYPKEQS